MRETITGLAWKWLKAGLLVSALAMSGAAQTPMPAPVPSAAPAPSSGPAISGSDLSQAPFGLVVSEIDFRGLSGSLSDSHLRELIDQKEGEPLDRAHIRTSIRKLYATGRFGRLDVEATRGADGKVALMFLVTENYFVGTVTVKGRPKFGPTELQMANSSKLKLGELYSRDLGKQAVESISRLMEDYGFYGTQISFEEFPHSETQQMDVVFHLKPRQIARVGRIELDGDAGLALPQFERDAKMKPGQRARNSVVPRALQRLRRTYQKQSRLEAQVSVVRHYQADSNTINYAFKVERGPVIDLHAEGARVSKGKMRRYVPVYQENAVDDDLLNEGRRNLRDHMQMQGYFESQVQVEQKPTPDKDKLEITYIIDRGERHKLLDIQIKGNKYLHDADLRPLLSIQSAHFLFAHGIFSQTMLANDVQAIIDVYQANGFASVKVTPEVKAAGDSKGGQLRVVINIEEGPQTRVQSLTVEGSRNITADQLRSSVLSMTEGQPYSEVNAGADRDSVLTLYFNRGYPRAEMEVSAKPHEGDATHLDVIYRISEGERVFVNRVLISGADKTQPHVINREFDIRDGAPLSQNAMLRTQSRLYDLGIFNSVDTAVQNPQGESSYKNVLYNFTEAKRWTLEYGLGFEVGTGVDIGQGSGPQGQTGISPRLAFDLTRINFGGRDQSIILKSRYGEFVKRGQITFDSPRWLDLTNWRLNVTAFYDNSRDVNTFASERLEGAVQFEEDISKSTKMLYRLSYRRVKVDPSSFPAGFDPALKFLYSQPVRVGMPSIGFIRDRRDDPLNSTKGSSYTADIGVATSWLGSEANFSRVLLQNSSYHGIGKKKGFILARATRLGFETPYSNTTVPLPEHFFVGGGNSHRGFAINQAGPRDLSTGGPLGGSAMLVNSLELRLPPAQLPYLQDNLSFVVFHDMGNAFDSTRHMWRSIARWAQPDQATCRALGSSNPPTGPGAPTACNFNYFSHAIGTGVRYRTPIGPVRLDLGYNLNPPIFAVRPVPAGTQAPYSQTARRFNIFFSIGQTF